MDGPRVWERVSKVLGRDVQRYEKQADILVELLELLERTAETKDQNGE